MGLLDLAPGIQEELLAGDVRATERELGPLPVVTDWTEQQGLWENVRP